jgi:hypothetical protein
MKVKKTISIKGKETFFSLLTEIYSMTSEKAGRRSRQKENYLHVYLSRRQQLHIIIHCIKVKMFVFKI